MKDQDTFDPYAVLGVPRNASYEDVRKAYRHRVRAYHPDNFAGIEVPREVLEYVTAMFTRLTSAYRELTEHHPAEAAE
jgi:DnaJ like chaperone protein